MALKRRRFLAACDPKAIERKSLSWNARTDASAYKDPGWDQNIEHITISLRRGHPRGRKHVLVPYRKWPGLQATVTPTNTMYGNHTQQPTYQIWPSPQNNPRSNCGKVSASPNEKTHTHYVKRVTYPFLSHLAYAPALIRKGQQQFQGPVCSGCWAENPFFDLPPWFWTSYFVQFWYRTNSLVWMGPLRLASNLECFWGLVLLSWLVSQRRSQFHTPMTFLRALRSIWVFVSLSLHFYTILWQ